MNNQSPPQFSLLTLLVIVSIATVCMFVWQQFQPMTDFEVVLSGPLSKELADDTVITIGRTSSKPEKPTRFSVSDIPFRLPFDKFANSPWTVIFSKPKEKNALFTVQLSHDLFDKPRIIDISLVSPKPKLRPVRNDWKHIRYTANISQRMHYSVLPYWTGDGELSPSAKQTPVLKVVNLTTGDLIWDDLMAEGCWGSRWYSRLPNELEVQDGHELRYLVDYQSGGTFGSIETEFLFKRNASRHR